MALLGYFEYHKFLCNKKEIKIFIRTIILTLLGIFDCFRWLFKGVIILGIAIFSITNGIFLYFMLVYLSYCWIPYVLVILIWRKQDVNMFPRAKMNDLIIMAFYYIFVPIVRSVPAFIGLFWMAKIVFRKDFYRPNTER
jgi:hypothetical protein